MHGTVVAVQPYRSIEMRNRYEPTLPHAQTQQVETRTREAPDDQAQYASSADFLHLHVCNFRRAHHAVRRIDTAHEHGIWDGHARRETVGNRHARRDGCAALCSACVARKHRHPCSRRRLRRKDLDEASWHAARRHDDVHGDSAEVGNEGIPRHRMVRHCDLIVHHDGVEGPARARAKPMSAAKRTSTGSGAARGFRQTYIVKLAHVFVKGVRKRALLFGVSCSLARLILGDFRLPTSDFRQARMMSEAASSARADVRSPPPATADMRVTRRRQQLINHWQSLRADDLDLGRLALCARCGDGAAPSCRFHPDAKAYAFGSGRFDYGFTCLFDTPHDRWFCCGATEVRAAGCLEEATHTTDLDWWTAYENQSPPLPDEDGDGSGEEDASVDEQLAAMEIR